MLKLLKIKQNELLMEQDSKAQGNKLTCAKSLIDQVTLKISSDEEFVRSEKNEIRLVLS